MLNVVGSIYLFFFVRVLDDGDFFFGYRSRSVGRSVDRPVSVSRSVGCFTAISKRGGSQLFFIAVNIRNAQLFFTAVNIRNAQLFFYRAWHFLFFLARIRPQNVATIWAFILRIYLLIVPGNIETVFTIPAGVMLSVPS